MSASEKSTRRTVEWLNDDEQRAWRELIAMLIALPAALDSDLQRATGLTMFEYQVLAHLSEADAGTLRMSELAYRANSSLSRLSHVVARLERKELVRKRPCNNDRRVSEVNLTRSGMKTVMRVAPVHVSHVREMVIDALTPTQLRNLASAASAITRRIEARS